MNVLFVNACVREASRTLVLARHVMKDVEGSVTELELAREDIAPLTGETLALRERLLHGGDLSHPMLRYAHQFAAADEIVVAAPYWDLSFPALLKIYFEQVTASGITFRYRDGRPEGLCRAKRLTYVTTAGGPILCDFGYTYVKTLAQSFYGIAETRVVRAAELDMREISADRLLQDAEIVTLS